MDINTITAFISSIGFPIAACVALYIMNTQQISKLTNIIDNNTKIMEELKDLIKGGNK